MKIVHIINSLHFGGAEKLLVDILPEFRNQDIEVDVIVLYNEKTDFYKALENHPKIKVIAPKKRRSLYSISHVLWIRKYIKKYDIVHVHLFPSLYWTALATLFLRDKPQLIITEHNTVNRRRSSIFFKKIDQYIYKKYTKIIAISESVKENIQTHLGINHSDVTLIYNGIDVKLFQEAIAHSKHQIGVPETAKIIIQVSSFFPQKDHDTLLKAISLLPDDVHLVLVGNGVLIDEKKALATRLKIADRVHFLGYRNDIPQLLKMADICVLSSHYEGFGLAIVEGMAAGLPCIGSDVDGLSQVIGNAGLIFDHENQIQLKEKLNQLLFNQKYYDEISKRCIERSKEYDISLMIAAHINLYKKLIK